MMYFLSLVLILVFLTNFILYWIFVLTITIENSKSWKKYTKIYLLLWAIPLLAIPILTSSFFNQFNGQISYFQRLWIWFLILGIIFIGIGIKLGTLYINKREFIENEQRKLNIKGIYSIMRHPMYTDWALTFIGLAFVFDSLISLIISPILLVLLETQAFLEEKFIYIPKYGKEKIETYRKKTPYKVFPSPYNWLLVIIALLVIYIGISNFILS